MAFKNSVPYLVMAGFLGFTACIAAAIVYIMRKGEKEAVTEVQRPAQVLHTSKKKYARHPK